jgi:protein-disulfide isomerase
MTSKKMIVSPSAHTADGGVLLGRTDVDKRLVVYEDPQCPYCRQFELAVGPFLRSALDAGVVAVEYRMRCFLGPESVRADNALALAAEAGHFDELRRELFAEQPPEQAGGFTTSDLLELGDRAGLASRAYVSGVQEGRYEAWALEVEERFKSEDPQGTPAAWLNGRPVDPRTLNDPGSLEELLRFGAPN